MDMQRKVPMLLLNLRQPVENNVFSSSFNQMGEQLPSAGGLAVIRTRRLELIKTFP